MKKLSKRQSSIIYMKENGALFSCPICSEEMEVFDDGNIQCNNRHNFTIAKQGYVNFLTKNVQTMYSKSLFESRKKVIEYGLYNEMQHQIANLIDSSAHRVLDTGCGEGSHLVRICNLLQQKVIGIGIDIAKEAIITAAKFYEDKIWCVGDLANSPFQKDSFDVILNILSPANYDEFKRLLKKNGKVIKVVPRSNYLIELRKQVFTNTEREDYTNEQTVIRFYEQFSKVEKHSITYRVPLNKEMIPHLLKMTPLSWHLEQQNISLQEITIDVDILVGEG